MKLSPKAMQLTLILAGIYNLAWGAVAIIFPVQSFEWLGMASPIYPQLWQCIGMIVGVYGIGYGIASFNPMVHWPIVLVGLLGKILGPAGFGWALIQQELPLIFGIHLITNDLIWWVPFSLILREAWRHHSASKQILNFIYKSKIVVHGGLK